MIQSYGEGQRRWNLKTYRTEEIDDQSPADYYQIIKNDNY